MTTAKKHPPFLSRRSLLGAGAGSLAFALLGCGGDDLVAGIGSGGTGSFSSGPIRGFGSILVGSIHYDESAAEVLDDAGQAMNASDLRLGMVVDVHGAALTTRAGGRREAKAQSVAVRSEIEGPVDDFNQTSETITVLGQVVSITSTTWFDGAQRDNLQALRGQVVEVSGYLQASGQYTATRIEVEDDQERRYKLRGVASKVDTAARTLQIGQALIFWGDDTAMPAQTLTDGQYLRIELGTERSADHTWPALAIRITQPGAARGLDRGAEAEMEGYISSVSPATSRFVVLGITVDYSRARFEDGTEADLALGVKVEVEGRIAADGMTLIASEVEFDDDDDDDDDDEFEVEGRITSVSSADRRFVVRSVTVTYDGQARFEDGTEVDLVPGAKVEVEGRLAADGVTLIASKIEFDD